MATLEQTQTEAVKPDKGDSKDFVEHLRTVHFTLVTVCLALIVICQFPSPVLIREAIHQLNTIIDATNQWKSTWLDVGVPEQLGGTKDFSYCIKPLSPSFTTVISRGRRVSIDFTKENWTVRQSDTTAIPAQYSNGTNRETSLTRPQRLDEFINIWNTKYSVICPLQIANEGLDQRLLSEPHPEAAVVRIKKEASSTNSTKVTAYIADGTINQKFKELHEQQNIESVGLYYALNTMPPKVATMSKIRQWSAEWEDLAFFEIPVLKSKVLPFDFKAFLIDTFPHNHWLHTDFKGAFYELDQATTGFQDLDFSHIKNILLQNEKNSKEAFQAFGVTFPIETTTRWGTLIIIVIQFYFLLHFMEYSKKRTLTTPDVAWIGIYASPGARFLFCTTALAGPFGVITFVCLKGGLLPNMPTRNFILCSVALIFSLLFAVLTAREYFRKAQQT